MIVRVNKVPTVVAASVQPLPASTDQLLDQMLVLTALILGRLHRASQQCLPRLFLVDLLLGKNNNFLLGS